jgi:23S rRNA pseudouridine1911/1915/1917 synthase
VLQRFPVTDSDRGRRLDLFLAERLPELSRSRIQQLLAQGCIALAGAPSDKPLKASYRLRGGEEVAVELQPPAPLRAYAEPLPLDILYENDDVIAVYKPAGMVVHAGAGVRSGTLVNALLYRFQNLSRLGGELRPGIVHRLDRNTSGVLLVAKNDAAHRKLAKQFARRTIEKHYTALVHGSVRAEQGTIAAPIRRDAARRVRMTARAKSGRAAETRYRVLGRYRGFTLLDVRIVTGRTHQARVHLASIGHPVVGDTLYGAPSRIPARFLPAAAVPPGATPPRRGRKPREETVPTLPRNFLHAARIRFLHPRTGAPVEVSAPLPAELAAFLATLSPLL